MLGMNHLPILVTSLYVGVVFVVARRLTTVLMATSHEDTNRQMAVYQQLVEEHHKIQNERRNIEEQTETMFTLYEVTREITKSFDESYARGILEAKLQAIKNDSPRDQEKKDILNRQLAMALRRIQLYQEVERLAMLDSLTQVYTRRYILERLQEEGQRSLSRQTPLSFLMIDVDHFKIYNDQHGHLVGDQLLREIAKLIQDNVREIDTVGRYGGEEFCVILPDTSEEDAHVVAERIRQAIEASMIKTYDLNLTATVSIGLAAFPRGHKIITDLIEEADRALYNAKGLGRNKVIFSREFPPKID